MQFMRLLSLVERLGKPVDGYAAFEMANRAGSWSTTTKEWTDPHKPPTESTGACEHTTLLGG